MMRLRAGVVVGALLVLAGCSSDKKDGSSAAEGAECDFGTTADSIRAKSSVGNSCSFEITSEDKRVARGTCTGALMRDTQSQGPAPGGVIGNLKATADNQDVFSSLDVDIVTADGKTFWDDMSGFSFGIADADGSRFPSSKGFASFGVNLSYSQASQMPSAASTSALATDENFVDVSCGVTGSSVDAEAFQLDIESAMRVCSFMGDGYYLVHGTIDATCTGTIGPLDGRADQSANVHVEF